MAEATNPTESKSAPDKGKAAPATRVTGGKATKLPGLTELGERTLAGYRERWGPDEGRTKFNEALEFGYIEKKKMVRSA
jgi:hypothetical protein